MEVHVGITQRSKLDSKSEILFCSKPTTLYTDPATYLSNIDLGDGIFIPFAEQYIYLGSVVSRNCTDVADVDARIKKAGKAFGTLRKCMFTSTQVSYAVKMVPTPPSSYPSYYMGQNPGVLQSSYFVN